MITRKDAWSEEEDQLLTDTVLEYVQNGDTKTSAFKKASEILGRTTSACAYRWNKELKNMSESTAPSPHKYKEKFSEAKKEASNGSQVSEVDLDLIINYLKQYKDNPMHELHDENERLKQKQNKLLEEQHKLEKVFEKKNEKYQQLVQKYDSVAKIFEDIKGDFKNTALQ